MIPVCAEATVTGAAAATRSDSANLHEGEEERRPDGGQRDMGDLRQQMISGHPARQIAPMDVSPPQPVWFR